MKIGFFLLTIMIFSSSYKVNKNQNCSDCEEKTIPLQVIKGTDFPDGAGCVFSFNTVAFDKKEYIFASDYNHVGVINMEGQDIFLEQKNMDSRQTKKIQDVYENDLYEILITTSKPYNKIDYTTYYKGSITFTNKATGERSVHPIYGECGC